MPDIKLPNPNGEQLIDAIRRIHEHLLERSEKIDGIRFIFIGPMKPTLNELGFGAFEQIYLPLVMNRLRLAFSVGEKSVYQVASKATAEELLSETNLELAYEAYRKRKTENDLASANRRKLKKLEESSPQMDTSTIDEAIATMELAIEGRDAAETEVKKLREEVASLTAKLEKAGDPTEALAKRVAAAKAKLRKK